MKSPTHFVIAFALFPLLSAFALADSDFVLLEAQRTKGTGSFNQDQCWVTASDGNTVYRAYVSNGAFQGCPVTEMNAHVRGAVKDRYLMLMLPAKGIKMKQATYVITSVAAAPH